MTLSKVNPGDKFDFTHFPAEAFNTIVEVRDLLNNKMGALPRPSFGGLPPGIVLVYNDSDSDLPLYTPAAIVGTATTPINNLESAVAWRNMPLTLKIEAVSASNKDLPIVILQEKVKSKSIGQAMLYGITPAKIKVTNVAHKYAKTISGSLESSDNGYHKVLCQLGSASGYTLIQLGMPPLYSGPFKLIMDDAGAIKVVSGMAENGAVAGYAMFNGALKLVPSGTVDGDGPGYICLQATFDSSSESVEWSYTISLYPEMEVSDTVALYPLGFADIDDDDNVSIIQHPHSVPQLWIVGSCDESSSGSASS